MDDETIYWIQFAALIDFGGIVAITNNWVPFAFYVSTILLRMLHALNQLVTQKGR